MTELQVKTKKGSLKKFLAMFLAFCVCLTTVFVDGAFAQAAESSAKFKKDTYTLERTEGAKLQLGQEVSPDNATVSDWTSSNAEKITVSESGDVTLTAQGKADTAKISAEISAKVSNVTIKCTVEVEAASSEVPDPTPTKKASFKKASYDLSREKNAEINLKEEVTPSDATPSDWSSDNAAKIAVANGVVTLTEAGAADTEAISAVISAKVNGETISCTVNVAKVEVVTTPSDATFKQSSYSLGRGANDKVDLGTEVSPSDAAKTGWVSNNTKIAVSDKGVVTLTAAGKADKNAISATITVTANDKPISCTVNVAKDSTTTPPAGVTDKVTAVTVNPTTLALKVGETGEVKATVKAEGKAATTVTWGSSDEKVATVKDGKVTAVAAGKTTITATSTFDKTKKATCEVTVTAEDKKDDKPVDTTVAVTSLTLNAKTVYLKTGAKLTVKAVVAPSNATDKKVTWTSNKKNIASVDSKGVIKAGKKTGKATITAKAGSKTAKVTVNVVKKAKKTTSVKLSKTKVTLKAKEQIALSATLSKGATSKVKWTTSDKKVAAVKDGVVTAKKKGTAVVTATADGKSADCVITVTDASGKKATALKANTKKISVKVKKTKKIKVSPKKGDKVKSYVSSNKKIATVSKKGVVTGKKKGKATIVVTTKKGAVATIPVTVK